MLNKAKAKIDNARKERQLRKEERARLEREQEEERVRLERERIQREKDTLMSLSDKELMVEAIMAIRGFNAHIENLEKQQEELIDQVEEIGYKIDSINSQVDSLM